MKKIKNLHFIYIGLALVLLVLAVRFYPAVLHKDVDTKGQSDIDAFVDSDENTPIPAAVPANPADISGQPSDGTALGGYNVLIADRGNNRLIEVTPDKKIVWEYHFDNVPLGSGADDSFFADGGKSVIVNLESYNSIQIIDYATKKVTWSYGSLDPSGKTQGILHTPDDAYKLPNGNIIVADIKNCRIIEISPDKKIVHQYGVKGVCKNKDGYTNKPNGDTPLPNGHVLISNIVGHDLVEIDENWKPIFKMNLPVLYPSDPQLTKAGNILVADYSKPGQVVEVSRAGKLIWKYKGDEAGLDKPSLAEELPNGNVILNDDFNHRVIVVDKATKKIVWQYGVTGKPGNGYDQLNIPDGLDFIKHDTSGNASAILSPKTIGSVTRHAENFIGKEMKLMGYMLAIHTDYAIFSDEPGGAVGYYDLVVTGASLDKLISGKKYSFVGKFLKDDNQRPVNGSPFRLEISSSPEVVK